MAPRLVQQPHSGGREWPSSKYVRRRCRLRALGRGSSTGASAAAAVAAAAAAPGGTGRACCVLGLLTC